MTRPTCKVTDCGKPAGDAFVCKTCGRDLERDLAETPWLVDELELVLTRQTTYGTRSGGRIIGKSTPLVFDVRASERMSGYTAALGNAARDLGARAVIADAIEPRKLARWLLLHVNELRHHPTGPSHVDAITRAFARARGAIDRPADRWYAGPCWVCSRDLFAQVGRPIAECTCGATYDVQTRRDYLLREAEDQLQNAVTIARAVSWLGAEPLTAARVRQWATRKRIAPRAWDRCSSHTHDAVPPSSCKACSPRYRVGDAIDLLAADTTRKEAAS